MTRTRLASRAHLRHRTSHRMPIRAEWSRPGPRPTHRACHRADCRALPRAGRPNLLRTGCRRLLRARRPTSPRTGHRAPPPSGPRTPHRADRPAARRSRGRAFRRKSRQAVRRSSRRSVRLTGCRGVRPKTRRAVRPKPCRTFRRMPRRAVCRRSRRTVRPKPCRAVRRWARQVGCPESGRARGRRWAFSWRRRRRTPEVCPECVAPGLSVPSPGRSASAAARRSSCCRAPVSASYVHFRTDSYALRPLRAGSVPLSEDSRTVRSVPGSRHAPRPPRGPPQKRVAGHSGRGLGSFASARIGPGLGLSPNSSQRMGVSSWAQGGCTPPSPPVVSGGTRHIGWPQIGRAHV